MALVPINVRISDEHRVILENQVSLGVFGENATLSDAIREIVSEWILKNSPPQHKILTDSATGRDVAVYYFGNADIAKIEIKS